VFSSTGIDRLFSILVDEGMPTSNLREMGKQYL
jgi:hypothetical protein